MSFVSGDFTWGTPRKLKAFLLAAVEFCFLLICISYSVCRHHLIVKKSDTAFKVQSSDKQDGNCVISVGRRGHRVHS